MVRTKLLGLGEIEAAPRRLGDESLGERAVTRARLARDVHVAERHIPVGDADAERRLQAHVDVEHVVAAHDHHEVGLAGDDAPPQLPNSGNDAASAFLHALGRHQDVRAGAGGDESSHHFSLVASPR